MFFSVHEYTSCLNFYYAHEMQYHQVPTTSDLEAWGLTRDNFKAYGFPQVCWTNLPHKDFLRPKVAPETVVDNSGEAVDYLCTILLQTDSDFLLTKEEVPFIEGLKNPCFWGQKKITEIQKNSK